jgi:hypothetical protein
VKSGDDSRISLRSIRATRYVEFFRERQQARYAISKGRFVTGIGIPRRELIGRRHRVVIEIHVTIRF